MANPLSYVGRPEEEDDDSPYSGISTRPPLEDPTQSLIDEPMDDMDEDPEAIAAPPPTPGAAVKAAIAKKMNTGPGGIPKPLMGPPTPDAYANEPGMQQFQKESMDMDKLRQAQIQSNLMTNMAQAGATLAQGSNAPRASDFGDVMSRQNAGLMKGVEDEADRRQKVIAAIEGRKGKETIAKSNAESRALARKAMQENRSQIASDRQKRMDNANIRAANSLLNSNANVAKETNKLNAARGVQTLIESIKKGDIVDSKNIRNQLSAMMSTIEMGGPGAVADRHAMGVDNLYTRAKDAVDFITSNPQKSIPPAYLEQIEHEANALGDRAAQNYKALADRALATADQGLGDPEADPGMVYKLGKQGRDKFLSSVGYDPETGIRTQNGGKEGMPSNAPGMTAPQEAAATAVRMMAPNGVIKMVPQHLVEAALKKGGKRID